MAHSAHIDQSSFTIDGSSVPFGRPIESIRDILGAWDRTYEGSLPAPTGHRNNVRYIYDNIGVSLLDHWTNQQLDDVAFYLELQPWLPYSPLHVWAGRLLLNGIDMGSNEFMKMVVGQHGPFRHRIGRIYNGRIGNFHITLEMGKTARSGKRIGSVSVSLVAERAPINQP